LKYGNPLPIDDVAADFPTLPIIMATFISLAGRSDFDLPTQTQHLHRLVRVVAEIFSPNLIQYANTLLKNKVMFGSDYPLITPDRWLSDFEKIGIRDEVRPLILKENAVRLLFGGA